MLTLNKRLDSGPKRIFGFIARYKYLLIALLLSVTVFHQWLSGGLFSYADGWFGYAVNLQEYLHPSVWTSSAAFGGFEQNLWRIPMNLLFGLPGLIGWDYAQSTKLLLLLPVIILPVLSSYLLIHYLFNNEKAAFVGCLLFGFNTYFLSIATQGHVLLTLAFGIGVFGFYFIVRQYDTPKWKYLLAAILCLFACGFADFRSLYLLFGLISAYTLFFIVTNSGRRLYALRDLGLVVLSIGVLNAFWLIPMATSGGGISSGVLGRPLFAPHFWTLMDAAALHHPFWNGADTTWFVAAATPWYLWCTPLLAVIAIALWPKKRFVLFFGIIAVIGVFLGKSSNAPFGELYQWAFTHIPGFDAFREGTKFYFYIALAYAILPASLVARLMEFKARRMHVRVAKYGIPVLIGGVSVLTLLLVAPYIFNNIAGFMQPRTIPSDYIALKDFLEKQPSYFRTFWLPTTSRWGLNANAHPAINATDVFYTRTQGLGSQYTDAVTGINMVKAIKDGRLANILDMASVKYVIVPLDDPANSDDFFPAYKTLRGDYISQLDQTSSLKRVDLHTNSLAVYENASYQPHISVSDTPYAAQTTQDIGKGYAFLKTNGTKNPLFVDSSDVKGAGLVSALFNVPSVVQEGDRTYLEDKFYSPSSSTGTLYKNNTDRSISYSTSSNKISIFSRPLNGPIISGNATSSNESSQVLLATSNLHKGSTYVVVDGVASLVQPNTTANLGLSKLYKSAGIYEAGDNLIGNSSFDSGPWQPKVSDCDNYDDNPQITQSIVDDVTNDGHRHALQLEASRHVACVSTSFNVTPNTNAFLNLDYRGVATQGQAGFHIQFNDNKNTTVDERPVLNNDQWSHLLRYVTVPNGATKATLYLYSYETDGKANNIIRYDNVSFSTAKPVTSIPLPDSSDQISGAPLKIGAGNNVVRYDMTDYQSHNLIANPSFEGGPWQSKVTDCSNYDANPKIDQSLNASDFTTGAHSLELDATRHKACTFLAVPLDTQGSQLLSFDYKSPNSGQGGYFISFNDPHQSFVGEALPTKDSSWKHFEKKVMVPTGATMAVLYLYAYESDGITKNIVRYDDVSLMRIPDLDNSFYVTSQPTSGLEVPSGIQFREINDGEYVIDVNDAKGSFLLHLGENYNKEWKLAAVPSQASQECQTGSAAKGNVQECSSLALNGQYAGAELLGVSQIASAARHIETNNFSNGWIIDPTALKEQYGTDRYTVSPDGGINFRLVAYYQPEAYLGIGAGISVIGLLTCIGLLGIAMRRN